MYTAVGQIPGVTSITETAEAKVQARIAEFLGIKAQLLTIRGRSQDSKTVALADDLYQKQLAAEETVKDALAAIEEIKARGVTASRFTRVASGTAVMEFQIGRFKSLHRRYLTEQGMSVPIDWAFWGRMGLIGLSAFFIIRRR